MRAYTLVASFAAVLLFNTCATTSPTSKPRRNLRTGTQTTQDKAGTKSLAEGTPGATIAETVRPMSFDKRVSEFLGRHQSSTAELTQNDRALLRAITNSNQNIPTHEAVMIVGVIKDDNPNVSSTSNFQETDMMNSGLTPSLESKSRRYGVNLSSAILNNSFVQSPGILEQIVDKIERSTDSANYRADVLSSVQTVIKRYRDLEGKIGVAGAASQPVAIVAYPSDATAPKVAATPTPPAVAAATPAAAATPIDPNAPPVLTGDELTMSEAQSLADAGKFTAAVGKLSAIPASSAQYTSAQQRIKLISNKGVQDLRQKAAQSFQKSLPLSDPNARLPYLEKAKSYLEQALNTFPNSDQISTVKENLAVINRDLEKMKTSN